MMAAVAGENPVAAERLADVPHWFETWEAHLSRFRPESELNRLNRLAGEEVPVSSVLWDVIEASLEAAQSSQGIVAPTVLEAVVAAGYDRTWEAIVAAGAVAPVREAPPIPDWRRIERDRRRRRVRLPEGTHIDLGGIGKGWGADNAARRLGKAGPALVDAGGDISVSSPMDDGEAWTIGVADPTRQDEQVALLRIQRGGVATSGRDYRRWRQGETWAHHLIDPRTGRPAETDVLAATVVGPSACAAETAAKTVVILGSRDGLAWLEARPSLAGLVVFDDGRVQRSRRMNTFLWG